MSTDEQGPRTADGEVPGAARRNRYFPGKLLTVADYRLEQSYHIERRRLINRVLHGWGVVAGLAVGAIPTGGWRVSPGVALDRLGREIVLCSDLDLVAPADVLWLRSGRPVDPPAGSADRAGAGSYLLCAHYAERWIDGVRVEDDYGDGASEANRVCETTVFALTPAPPEGAAAGDTPPPLCPSAGLARIGALYLDPDAGVPLARVALAFGKNGVSGFGAVDAGFARPALRAAATPFPVMAAGDMFQHAPKTGGPLIAPAVPVAVPASVPVQAIDDARQAESAWAAQERKLAAATANAIAARTQLADAVLRLAQASAAVQQAEGAAARGDTQALQRERERLRIDRESAEADLAKLTALAQAGEKRKADAAKALTDAGERLEAARSESKKATDEAAAASVAAAAASAAALPFPRGPFGISIPDVGRQQAAQNAQAAAAAAIAKRDQAEQARAAAESEFNRLADADAAAGQALNEASPQAIAAARARLDAAVAAEHKLDEAAAGADAQGAQAQAALSQATAQLIAQRDAVRAAGDAERAATSALAAAEHEHAAALAAWEGQLQQLQAARSRAEADQPGANGGKT